MKTQTSSAFEALESRVLLSTVAWDGGGGDLSWDNPLNWSADVLPGSADDVVIDVPGSIPTINLGANAVRAVKSLKSSEGIRLSAGSLAVGSLWAQNGPFAMTGGSLGGTGNLYLNGDSEWSGGTIMGAGRLHVMPGNELVIDGDVTLARTLVNNGRVDWQSGTILSMGSTILNMPGRTFAVESEGAINPGRSLNLFTNLGTLVRSGPGTTTFGVILSNQGEVDVNGGTLSLAGGTMNREGDGVLRGGVWVVNHATLDMPGGDIVRVEQGAGTTEIRLIGATASFPAFEHVQFIAAGIPGTASLTLSGGRAFTFSSLIQVGTLTIDNDGVTVVGSNLAMQTLNVARGTTRWTGGGAVNNTNVAAGAELDLAGVTRLGSLAGPGLVRIQDQTLMYYGEWTGGAVIVDPAGTLQISGVIFLVPLGIQQSPQTRLIARRVINYGTITVDDFAGEVRLGAELVNRGTINLLGFGYIGTASGLTPTGVSQTITNFGVINKDGMYDMTLRGAGGGVRLANLGTVHVRGGRLIAAGGGLSTGLFVVDSGSEMVWGGLPSILTGAHLSGAGGVRVAGPMQWTDVHADLGQNLLVTAPGSLTVNGTGNDFSVANLLNAGTLTLAHGAVAHVTPHGGWFTFGPVVVFGGQLINRGTLDVGAGATLDVSGRIELDAGSVLRERIESATSIGVVRSTTELSLDGTLNTVFTGGYVPEPGVHFTFMTSGSEVGAFAGVTTVGLPLGRYVSPQYVATAVTLTVFDWLV